MQHKNLGARVAFENVLCKQETKLAILCSIKGEELWFPLSNVFQESQVRKRGSSGTLLVSEWIAWKKGLVRNDSWEEDSDRDSYWNVDAYYGAD